jgi:glycosyltransferase involved in cell wall biosynthesis
VTTSLPGAAEGARARRTDRVPVSVMVFTLDEEIHLPSCLASLAWCDDVIVVDSFSRDTTEAIAREAGARFYQHRFAGFGSQRNWALEHTQPKHEWILVLDADERTTPELVDEMRRVLGADTSDVGAFRVKRRFHMWGRWLRHSGLYPSYVVRLIHRDRVRYSDRGHSETQTVQGRTLSLEHDLIDENLRGIDGWFARHNRYSSKEAEYELQHEQVRLNWSSVFSRDPLERRFALRRLSWRVPARPVVYFLYAYLWRGGWRDGRDGLTFCLMKALYQGMIATKKYDASRSRGP